MVLVSAAYLAWAIIRDPTSFGRPIFIPWAVAMATVSLFPLSAWRESRVGMEFPLSIAVAVLYGPGPAALITLFGSFDRRELRGEVSLLRALFNRSQVALAAAVAGEVFHAIASPHSAFPLVIAAGIPAVIAGYAANVGMVATAARLELRLPLHEILARFTVGGLPQFLISYLLLGLLGAGLAGIQDRLRELTAVALIAPLLLARYLYLRGQVLERTSRELERSGAQMRMLQGLTGKLDELNDVRRIAQAIVDDLSGLIEYHDCRVYQLQPDGATLLPLAFGPSGSTDREEIRQGLVTKVGEGITGRAAQLGHTIVVPDARHCEFAVTIPGTPDVDESIVAVPLRSRDRTFGTLVLAKDGIDQFDERDIQLLEVLASRAAVAFENALLLQRERANARWYRTLVEQLPALTYLDRPDGSALYVSPAIEGLLGYTPSQWVDRMERWERHVHSEDRESVRAARQRSRATGEPFVLEYRMHPRAGGVVWVRDQAVLVQGSKGPSYWQGVVVDITELKQAEDQIAFLAFHDGLTGLPNRTMFQTMLERALARGRRYGRAVAVIALDLDDFKLVNDGLGHDSGDELLRRTATILRETIRETDVAARMGGDEFLVMLPDLPGEAAGREALIAVAVLTSRIQDRLRSPQALAGTELYLSASIGVSVYPLDAEDARSLVQNADAAMYENKKDSSSPYTIYVSPAYTNNRLSLMTRLHKAADECQWELWYQPVVDLTEGRPSSIEALIRWRTPDGTLIPPGEFLAPAEEMGLMPAIGDWVVEELCRQLVAWRARGVEIDASFNLSPRQLWNPALMNRIPAILTERGVDPRSVIIEITESAVMTDLGGVSRSLQSLHDLGVRLAIDDFGTGYSSLSRLKDLPVDIVKIDRSFVRDLSMIGNVRRIVTAMVGLITSLGLVPIAEGIETEMQHQFLVEHGCHLGQGFLFSRPMPAEQVAGWIARPKAGPSRSPHSGVSS